MIPRTFLVQTVPRFWRSQDGALTSAVETQFACVPVYGVRDGGELTAPETHEVGLDPRGLAELAARLIEECDRYGLPHDLDMLLRHVYANRDATLGAKDLVIALLQERLDAAGRAARYKR